MICSLTSYINVRLIKNYLKLNKSLTTRLNRCLPSKQIRKQMYKIPAKVNEEKLKTILLKAVV